MTDYTQTIHPKDPSAFANASLELSTHNDSSEVVPRRSSRSRGHSANNSKTMVEETKNDFPLKHLVPTNSPCNCMITSLW